MAAKLSERLSAWELRRMTAAEVCIDELMATMERHGLVEHSTHRKLMDLSDWLDNLLLECQGPQKRYDMLLDVRDRLNEYFPVER